MTAEKANLAKKIPPKPKKKVIFSTSRISRSGKGRVGDFSATRVRVESFYFVSLF
jgi:hypothetical protein